MVDLSQFDALTRNQEEGIDVDILHPVTGDELGIKIRVAGVDSERFRRARHAVQEKRIQRRSVKRQTPAEIDEENLSSLAQCIISWSGVVIDGKAIELTHDSAVDVLRRYPFLRDQVDVAVGDRAGFMQS